MDEWHSDDAAEDEPSTVHPLGWRQRARIRWAHRGTTEPRRWKDRVEFDELVLANDWDLAPNFDALNDRYSDLDER